jgi:hypothetical protein
MAHLNRTTTTKKLNENSSIGETDVLKKQIEEERRAYVNVAKIRRIVKAKIDNSKLAFSFLRYFCFLCIYCAAIILQREPQNTIGMTAALTNYFLAYRYRDPNSFDLKSFTDIQTTTGD